jgi:hypothetical protein
MNATDTARGLARAILDLDADPSDLGDAARLVLLNLIHAKGGDPAEGVKVVALTMLFAQDWALDLGPGGRKTIAQAGRSESRGTGRASADFGLVPQGASEAC